MNDSNNNRQKKAIQKIRNRNGMNASATDQGDMLNQRK